MLCVWLLAATAQSAYEAPTNAYDQPDLSGNWTNASLTREVRPPILGDRAVYTPQEVARLEGFAARQAQNGNRPTNPNAPAPPVERLHPAARNQSPACRRRAAMSAAIIMAGSIPATP